MTEIRPEQPETAQAESTEAEKTEPVDIALLREMAIDTLSDADAQRLLEKTEEVGRATKTEPLHVLYAVSLELKETGGKLTPDGLLAKLEEFKQVMMEDEEPEDVPAVSPTV
jgi:hypothetical protein